MIELEMMEAHDRHELPLPDMVILYQLLVQRGWIWKMPSHYQAQAVAFLNMGLIGPRKEGNLMGPKILILTKDGKIEKILTEGVIDVVVQDEEGITVAYTSVSLPDSLANDENGPGDQGVR
jgi:hypothetical protein